MRPQATTQPKAGSLSSASTRQLLEELCRRHGTFRAVARAQLLVLQKSVDYNGTEEPGALRDLYFPHGALSYSQMIWTKALRFQRVAAREGGPNFESLEDTALDLISYASFFLEWKERARGDGGGA